MNSKFKTAKGRKRQANRKAYVKRKAAASAKVPAKVKAYVKKAIDAEIQDKVDLLTVFSTAGGSTTGNVRGFGIDNTSTFYGITSGSIIPTVAVGTTEDTRVGNYIKPKSMVVRYTIHANPIDKVTLGINKNEGMPFYVAVVFYSRKDSRGSSINDALKDLGNSSVPFATIQDFLVPFNKELYNIHAFKKYKMHPSQSTELVGTTQVVNSINAPAGCVSMVMASQKIKLPSKLIYDDASTVPTNARVYCAIGVFNFDNSTLDRSTQIRARVEMTSTLTYQNA